MVNRAYFVIEDDVPLFEISRAVGMEPTASRRYNNRLLGREVTEWRLDLEQGANSVALVDATSRALLQLGRDVASRVAKLVDSGATAALVIAQVVTDDQESTGMHFSSEVVRWLAAAKATISIDQSVASERFKSGTPSK
jgi:hypothetical protein